MATRYIPSDLDQPHETIDPTNELVRSLEKLLTGYPPKDSYDSYECHGLYSGPTSIAYLFLRIWRSHPYLTFLGKHSEAWFRAYLNGKRIFPPATLDKNGVGSETLAFHAVKAIMNRLDSQDEEKMLKWMEPVYETNEGRVFYIISLLRYTFSLSLIPLNTISEAP